MNYTIVCMGGVHLWKRRRYCLPQNPTKVFAHKRCDCSELVGIMLPMRSATKVRLGYYAPGTVVL